MKNISTEGFFIGLAIGFWVIIFQKNNVGKNQKKDTSFGSFMKLLDQIIPEDFSIEDTLKKSFME